MRRISFDLDSTRNWTILMLNVGVFVAGTSRNKRIWNCLFFDEEELFLFFLVESRLAIWFSIIFDLIYLNMDGWELGIERSKANCKRNMKWMLWLIMVLCFLFIRGKCSLIHIRSKCLNISIEREMYFWLSIFGFTIYNIYWKEFYFSFVSICSTYRRTRTIEA